ncbi:MAG: DUF503 domain-containing protein [Gemmataceae bacterium]
MVIGTIEARLLVRESRSLKDKRQVARSILDRLRSGFSVSAGEVDTHDDHRLLTLGIAVVGHEVATIQGVLQTITQALRTHPIAEFLGADTAVGHEVV